MTKDPTCTDKGSKTFKCTRNGCSETKTEEIAANGHTWNDVATVDKEPTCTEEGSKSVHCKNCSATQGVEEIAALGHSWDSGEVTTAPTETIAGEITYHCTRDGCEGTKTESVASLGTVNNTVSGIVSDLPETPSNEEKATAVAAFQQIDASGIACSLETGATGTIATQMKAIEDKTGAATVANNNNEITGVSIIGGGLNAATDNNTVGSVSLKIDAVDDSKKTEVLSAVPDGVETDNAVVMSMSLEGAQTDEDGNLLVPVLISFAVPDGIDADDMVVVHESSIGVELLPVILSEDKKTASIVVKHFSDFVITETTTKTITADMISAISEQTYTGSAITPELTITYEGATLAKDTDYSVTYENNVNAGAAKAIVTGIGNYTGNITVEFTIKESSSDGDTGGSTGGDTGGSTGGDTGGGSSGGGGAAETSKTIANATLAKTSYAYTGKAIKPDVTVVDSEGNTLKAGTDYTVTYTNNTNPGEATVTVTGIGDYNGSKITLTFTIVKENTITAATLKKDVYEYTGKGIVPAITVTDQDGKTLKKNTDYTVQLKNNKNVGTATAVVSGIGDYEGNIEQAFTINPKSVKIALVKAGKKAATVKWKKPGKAYLKQMSGYEIVYDTSKAFANAETVKAGRTNVSKTIRKLQSKKRYYFKTRTYKTVNGKKYYSEWSKVRSAKTK